MMEMGYWVLAVKVLAIFCPALAFAELSIAESPPSFRPSSVAQISSALTRISASTLTPHAPRVVYNWLNGKKLGSQKQYRLPRHSFILPNRTGQMRASPFRKGTRQAIDASLLSLVPPAVLFR